ncbi:galaxin-like [Argopecten irradians]|uniref:galaxin-like n=1 Tax=Argopecten irradians TaxID=31199 RepID=UPI00372271E6
MCNVNNLVAVCLFVLKGLVCVQTADCEGKEYNPSNAFCCGSTIHDHIKDGKQWDCCEGANRPYSNSTAICCGSQIRTKERFLGCCRGRFYSSNRKTCCEDSGKLLRINGRRQCCGANTFNTARQLCCGDAHVLFVREKNTHCCGNNRYNDITHYCNENDNPVRKGFKRCRNLEYNPLSEICCDEGVFDMNLKYPICCHSNIIFPSLNTHYCLGNTVLKNNETICDKTKIMRKSPKQNQCCGKAPFDNTTEQCSNGKVVPLTNTALCGGKPMDTKKDLCCDNVNLFKNGKKRRKCCGGRPIKRSCKCCPQFKRRNKCCRNKTKRIQKTIKCQPGRKWSTISELVDGQGCLKQAIFVKKLKTKNLYRKKKHLFGRKEKTVWKLDKSTCSFIKKKEFVIVRKSAGDDLYVIKKDRKNLTKLKNIKKNCGMSS